MLRPLCTLWAYGSGTGACTERARTLTYASVPYTHAQMRISFPIFQIFILYTLSMPKRNWSVHWACASGTDANAEHTHQELMRALSIRVRKWCVHWVYASGTYACTERSPFRTCWAYPSGTDAYPERTHQELVGSLSIHARNWCVSLAYASVSYAYAQHKHKKSRFEKVPSKHAEHTRKELMRALNERVRNWCVHWTCASGTDACTERMRQELIPDSPKS
jgi:hypothetical protein